MPEPKDPETEAKEAAAKAALIKVAEATLHAHDADAIEVPEPTEVHEPTEAPEPTEVDEGPTGEGSRDSVAGGRAAGAVSLTGIRAFPYPGRSALVRPIRLLDLTLV